MRPAHKFKAEKIPNSTHEHGSHYSYTCDLYNVVCSCGEIIQRSTCYPCVNYDGSVLNELGHKLMFQHRLDYLESKLLNK